MDDNKEAIGFPTSARQIEDSFDSIRRLLGSKKVAWANLVELAEQKQIAAERDLVTTLKGSKASPDLLLLVSRTLEHWSTLGFLGRLGTDIAETHERLAKVEKAVQGLKLLLK